MHPPSTHNQAPRRTQSRTHTHTYASQIQILYLFAMGGQVCKIDQISPWSVWIFQPTITIYIMTNILVIGEFQEYYILAHTIYLYKI